MAIELSNTTAESLGLTTESPAPYVVTIPEADLRAELEKARSVDTQSNFLNGFGIGVAEDHIASLGIRNMYRFTDTPINPVADMTPELAKQLTEGLTDPRAIEDVLEAAQSVSFDYAAKMANDYKVTEYHSKQLAQQGWSGLGGYFLAQMTDPVEWATILGTTAAVSAASGVAAPVTAPVTAAAGTALKTGKAAKKTYNVWKMAKSGLAVGAVEAAAFEGIRARLKYDVDGGDVLLAMLIGGTIGTVGDGVSASFRKSRKLHEIDRKLAVGEPLDDFERTFYNQYGGDKRVNQLIERAEQRGDFLDPEDRPLTWTEAEAAATTKQLGGFGRIRGKLSAMAQMKNSDNGYSRLVADRLGLNSAGNRAGADGNRAEVNFSATEIKSAIEFQYRTSFARSLHFNRKEWVRRTGGGIDDFNVLVSKAIRSGNLQTMPKEVRAVAEHVMESQRNLGQKAIDYNVAGFTAGTLDRQPNYLPRLFKEEKMQAIKKKYGNERAIDIVAELVEKAVRNAQPDIKMKASAVSKMSRGYAKTILSPELHSGHRATEFNMEDLRDALKAEELTDLEIDNIIDDLTKSTTVKAHKRARPRLLLDENVSIQVRTDNGDFEDVAFTDLLEEDIENLHNAYVFQMSGAIGLARNGINTNDLGTSFETIVGKMRREAEAIGQTSRSLDRDIKSAEFMYDAVTGRLGFEDGVSLDNKQFMRRAREASFMINMGMSGMSAMMEITNALMEYSIPTLFKAMPHYRRLYARAANGQLSSPLLRELEAMTGLGADTVTGKFTRASRFEGDTMDVVTDGDVTKFDEMLGRGREQMSYWSGLSGVTGSLRRLSMLNYTTQWARAAKKGNDPFAKIKMEQLGISPDMARRIRNQINKHSDIGNDGVLNTINTKAWTDPRAREIFELSVFREATQNVQEVNVGSVNRFLRSDIGKTFFQFLSFPLAAVEQQMMRLGVRAAHGDAATVSKVILAGAFMGTMMYTARVYMNAEGRGDKEEYIKRQMSWDRFLEGSMSQIGAASMFGYIYQITTGAMDGNNYALTPASVSIGQGLIKGLKIPYEAVSPNEDVSEGELRSALRLIPFSSLYGARQIINGIADTFTGTN
jgi:hypothetical protein